MAPIHCHAVLVHSLSLSLRAKGDPRWPNLVTNLFWSHYFLIKHSHSLRILSISNGGGNLKIFTQSPAAYFHRSIMNCFKKGKVEIDRQTECLHRKRNKLRCGFPSLFALPPPLPECDLKKGAKPWGDTGQPHQFQQKNVVFWNTACDSRRAWWGDRCVWLESCWHYQEILKHRFEKGGDRTK